MDYKQDASPRGGEPGFVKITTSGSLLIPDAPGNNRLDSFNNILATGKVVLLFLIPGFDETLRVNGSATLSTARQDVARCANERRAPKVVIRVAVTAANLHCAKAFMRAKPWQESAKTERSALPTIGQMIGDQTGLHTPPEKWKGVTLSTRDSSAFGIRRICFHWTALPNRMAPYSREDCQIPPAILRAPAPSTGSSMGCSQAEAER